MNNINITNLGKKSYTINEDTSKTIELDPTDLLIITRANENLDKIGNITEEAFKATEESDLSAFATKLKECDARARECINTIFDYDVCSVIYPTGSLFNAKDGKFVWEHICESLMELYAENIKAEFEKVQKRVTAHTKKYVNKK